jgi:hypothetical protein
MQPIDDRAWCGPAVNGARRSWDRQPIGGDTLLVDEISEPIRSDKNMRDTPVTNYDVATFFVQCWGPTERRVGEDGEKPRPKKRTVYGEISVTREKCLRMFWRRA